MSKSFPHTVEKKNYMSSKCGAGEQPLKPVPM
jgi:hypothetical protein